MGAFLVLGKDGGQVVRQIGRLYGRLTRIKSELLGEFARAAEIPPPVPGQFVSLRQSLLEWEPPTAPRTVGIPVAVASPPGARAGAERAAAPPLPDWSPSIPPAGYVADPRRNN